MVSIPTEQQLSETLTAAGSAHHDYESNFLGGARDEQWAGWYSAYVLGRLGDSHPDLRNPAGASARTRPHRPFHTPC